MIVLHLFPFFVDMDQDTLNLALLQYCFISGEHEVKIAPHGNSKSGSAYVRTMSSVMTKLKQAATQKTPKRALQFVSDEQDGVLSRTASVQNHVTSYFGRELQSTMAAQCALCTIL